MFASLYRRLHLHVVVGGLADEIRRKTSWKWQDIKQATRELVSRRPSHPLQQTQISISPATNKLSRS